MATSKKITTEQAMEDLAKRKHIVEESKASTMVKKYKTFRTRLATAKKNGSAPANTPDLPVSITYNKKAIQNLLKKTGCTGLRIYPAINEGNSLTFVLVGVDEYGENIINGGTAGSDAAMVMKSAAGSGGTVDEGQTSPPYPAATNGF